MNKLKKSIVKEPVDSELFALLHEIKVPKFQATEYSATKTKFYRDLTNEPASDYSFALNFDITDSEKKLQALRTKIERSRELLAPMVDCYRSKAQELGYKIKIFNYSKEQVKKGIDRKKEIYENIELLFGAPDSDIFFHLLGQLKIDYDKKTYPIIRSGHYKKIESLFADIPKTSVVDLSPVPEKDFSDDTVITSSEKVKNKVLEALHKSGLEDWAVIISKRPFGGFSVKPMKKMIVVPSSTVLRARKGERQLTEQRLTAVIHHEVLTHAVRADNGFKSSFRLLGTGLAGYWRGEEGIATYREQQILGATDYVNRHMHLAVGLAYGLDRNGEKRTFFETFKILHDYFYVFANMSGRYSKQKAYDTCHRIFRCTTGEGTGYVSTQDILYREGNIAIHELLKKNPEAEKWFDVGKFDPSNTHHVAMLKELKIIT